MTTIAVMDTEHFNFIGVGEDIFDAGEALLAGFLAHLEGARVAGDEPFDADGYFRNWFDGPANLDTLSDWYGIRYMQIEHGCCYRDHDDLRPLVRGVTA